MSAPRAWCHAPVLLLTILGCKTAQKLSATPTQASSITQAAVTARSGHELPAPTQTAKTQVVQVAFQDSLPRPPGAFQPTGQEEFAGSVLTREWLAAEVEARNPSLEAMIAAWQAAAQLYPQRVALDDPMLMGMIAPQSAVSNVTETAYAFQLNQKLPWFGKRRLRGAAADADADAAYNKVEDSRLQVRLAAELAFYEYFLAARLIEINRENTQIMERLRDTAQSRFRTSQVTQQDVLQADLELADLARRQLELERMQRVAMARINTLVRRWPDAPVEAS